MAWPSGPMSLRIQSEWPPYFPTNPLTSILSPGIQAMLGPARAGELVGSGEFALPVFDFALIILDVEINLTMRIDETKVGDGALHRKRIARIIGRGAVVSKHKARKSQNDSNNCKCR